MNKIFKIVWNAARGKMMVVNEATSSVQTGKKAAVTVATASALMILSGSAFAVANDFEIETVAGVTTYTKIASPNVVTVVDPGKDLKLLAEVKHKITVKEDANLNIHKDLTLIGNYGVMINDGSSLSAENIHIEGQKAQYDYSGVKKSVIVKNAVIDASENLTIQGAGEGLLEGAVLNGKDIQILGGSNKYFYFTGGEINASSSLTLEKRVDLTDTVISVTNTDGTATLTNSAVNFFKGNTNVTVDKLVSGSQLKLKNNTTLTVGVLDIQSNFDVCDQSTVTVTKEAYLGKGRIQLIGSEPIQIPKLTIKDTGAKLVDKLKNTEDGVVSFDIENVIISDNADLTVYSDEKDGFGITKVDFGTVDVGEGAELNLGFRETPQDDDTFSIQGVASIDTLVLGNDSKVTVKEGSRVENESPDLEDNADVEIKKIQFEGKADIAGNLVGDETDITVDEGVEGASIAKLSSKKARIQISDPTTEGQLGIEEVADGSSVDVTTGTENNTGDAQADLDKLAKAISVDTNNGTVNLSIGESDYDGAVSGQLGSDGTATNVVQQVNSLMSNTLDIATAAPLSMNRLLMNDVRKRMGDLRASEGTHGVWARYDGGKFKGDAGLENDFNTIQVGIDTVPVADAPRFGVAFAYTKSDADMNRGSADMDAFSLAFYGTKFYDNGMFVDVIGRMATADTDLTVDGDKKGSMDNVALSLSGELGWRFDVTDQFYVEPQAELTYTYVNAEKLTLSNGSSYDFDAVDSLLGRVGFAAGFKCPSNFGDVYVRASAVHEFLGDSAVTGGNGTIHEVDGEDTWVEFGIGANFNINKNTYVYADIERTEGAKLEEDWRANVGVRFAF